MKRTFINVSHKMKISYLYQGKKKKKTIDKDTTILMESNCRIKIRIYDDDFFDFLQIIFYILKYIIIGVFCLFIDSIHRNMKSFCFTDNELQLENEEIIDCSIDEQGALLLETTKVFYYSRIIKGILMVGSLLFFVGIVFLIGLLIHQAG